MANDAQMPERIWLIPDIGWDGETAWSNDPAPEPGMDPDNATEYRRADLCASGQQVRALEWEQVDPTAVLGHGIEPCQYYIRYEVGFWWMPGDAEVEDAQEFDDLEAAKAAAQADYERRILSALTPAPQPEGQIMDGWVDDKTFIEPVSPTATPTAQEAVAWRCKDYADGWILYGNKAQAELYQACTGCLMEALYAPPPQPSETVAEALREIRAAVQDGNLSQGIRLDIIDKIAMRALKGDE